jgi:hypothetical protein
LSVVRFTHNTSEDDSASGDLEKTKPWRQPVTRKWEYRHLPKHRIPYIEVNIQHILHEWHCENRIILIIYTRKPTNAEIIIQFISYEW